MTLYSVTHQTHHTFINSNTRSGDLEQMCGVKSMCAEPKSPQDGAAPLYIASETGHCELVHLLISFGAKINAQAAVRGLYRPALCYLACVGRHTSH